MVEERASLKTGFPLGLSPFSSLVSSSRAVRCCSLIPSFPHFLTGHGAYLAKTPAPRPISANCIRRTTPLFPQIAWLRHHLRGERRQRRQRRQTSCLLPTTRPRLPAPDCPPLTARRVYNSATSCHVLRLSPINTSTMYMSPRLVAASHSSPFGPASRNTAYLNSGSTTAAHRARHPPASIRT